MTAGWGGGKFKTADIALIGSHRLGAIAAAAVLMDASGKDGSLAGGFASNGYGDLSPKKYAWRRVCVIGSDVLLMIIRHFGARVGWLCAEVDRSWPTLIHSS